MASGHPADTSRQDGTRRRAAQEVSSDVHLPVPEPGRPPGRRQCGCWTGVSRGRLTGVQSARGWKSRCPRTCPGKQAGGGGGSMWEPRLRILAACSVSDWTFLPSTDARAKSVRISRQVPGSLSVHPPLGCPAALGPPMKPRAPRSLEGTVGAEEVGLADI